MSQDSTKTYLFERDPGIWLKARTKIISVLLVYLFLTTHMHYLIYCTLSRNIFIIVYALLKLTPTEKIKCLL